MGGSADVPDFGELGAQVPEAFIKDREQLSGRPFDPAAMAAAVPFMATQFRGHAAFIEEGLADRPWLAGNRPGMADAAAYMNIWFAGRNVPATTAKLLAGLPRVVDWSERMRALRQTTPFAGVLSPQERWAIYDLFPQPGTAHAALRS